MRFDIQPLRGALPILFGMSREEVIHILGSPKASHPTFGGSGTTDCYPSFNIGYDKSGRVNHLGFTPGGVELAIQGEPLWDTKNQPDPNPFLLSLDPEPVESVGFWYFPKLGITSTGFHDADPSQRAVTVCSPDNPNAAIFADAEPADTSQYKLGRKKPKK